MNTDQPASGDGIAAALAPQGEALPPGPERQSTHSFVFLICSERSGSNLVSAILNAHPAIVSTPPLHLCRDVGLAWHALIDPESRAKAKSGFNALIAQRLAKFCSQQVARDFLLWSQENPTADFGLIARQAFVRCCSLANRKMIFIKENNLHRMLFFILHWFPSARFVFQVRDPRDFLLSAQRRKEGPYGNKFGSNLRAMETWRADQLGGLAALAHLGPERVFFQRYEDLVAAPEVVLPALCAFLGVAYVPTMLDFHSTEYSARLAVPGGPRENLDKPLLAQNFGKYREGLDAEQIRMVETTLGPLMQRFGYELDDPGAVGASRQERLWPMLQDPLERLANGARFAIAEQDQDEIQLAVHGIVPRPYGH